ncbi:Fc receptor-like protein 5 [Stigmatopora argus]
MNMILIPSWLGVAAFLHLLVASLEDLKVILTLWPPDTKVFLGECLLLQCTVEGNSTFGWRYRWFRSEPGASRMEKSPRHMLSGGSYSITAVTSEDGGRYWCQAQPNGNATEALLSRPITLNVSGLDPPSLTLAPNSRQLFIGETFTLQCPKNLTNSSVWVQSQTLTNHLTKLSDSMTATCSSQNNPGRSGTCVVSATRGHSGLYWCEGAGGRSNAIHLTISSGPVIMRTPVYSVPQGSSTVLSCRYRKGNYTKSTFFRNGVKAYTCNSSGVGTETKLTLENVGEEHEGFYKCASQDGKLESPQSWLSVKRNLFSVDEPASSSSGSWIWVVVSCIIMILIPLAYLLIHHLRHKMLYTHSCWTIPGEETPAGGLPATKQDGTEVQWDLSWMEMSNLLSPGT